MELIEGERVGEVKAAGKDINPAEETQIRNTGLVYTVLANGMLISM